MTPTELLEADLEEQIPQLLSSVAVVALVPATELRGWAAEMAWRVARAAAALGRRTVLVDCFVNAPTLHGSASSGNTEGIVDAFEYGASLNRIVQQQPQADLFFIPAGTYTADAEPVMQHPRWRRLSAGFRHEEALLLLYVAAEHLGSLAAEPDGIIVLAPQGQNLAVAEAPALTEAVAKGMPLLAVVAEFSSKTSETDAQPRSRAGAQEEMPAAEAAPLFKQRDESGSPKRVFAIIGILFIAVLLALGLYLYRVLQHQPSAISHQPTANRSQPIADTARPAAPRPAPAPVVALPPSESLPWAVQVAALPRLSDAFAMGDSLEAHGRATMIAPVQLRGRGTFYRVQTGPYAARARADSMLAQMRTEGLLARGTGAVSHVPLSIALANRPTKAAAVAERARLRTHGVPTFILGQSDGTFRLYAGAFDAAAQASLLHNLLTPTGSAGDVVLRSGYVP